MNRDQRHRILQRLLWSPFGFRVIRWSQRFGRKWGYVVLNRSLNSTTNGEYWLISQLPPQPLVFDVGFNTGDFSREVLRQRPASRIVGFDPARPIQRLFAETLAGETRVRLEPLALSHEAGEARFYDSDTMSSSLAPGRSDQASAYVVSVSTLDRYTEQHGIDHIDLVKIDAEGFDLNVLEGAGRLLDGQKIDIFLFEYADGWINNRRFLKEAVDYLAKKPYQLYRLFNGFLSPFTYDVTAERFDLGCMFVGVSHRRKQRDPLPERAFPA
jgi:FkbM family methyltransferase